MQLLAGSSLNPTLHLVTASLPQKRKTHLKKTGTIVVSTSLKYRPVITHKRIVLSFFVVDCHAHSRPPIIIMTSPLPHTTSSSTISKTPSIQSVHSHSTLEPDVEASEERHFEPLSMTEKGDIEVYPDGANYPQNEKWDGAENVLAKEGTVTRTSTKSSWKDPGPPPDGGLMAWTQGMHCSR